MEVNHGLDLEVRLENLVMTGACLSSNEERVVFLRVIKILTFSDCADCE